MSLSQKSAKYKQCLGLVCLAKEVAYPDPSPSVDQHVTSTDHWLGQISFVSVQRSNCTLVWVTSLAFCHWLGIVSFDLDCTLSISVVVEHLIIRIRRID